MGKKLCDMSLQELWHLFPIQLTAYNDKWNSYFKEAFDLLTVALSDYNILRLTHIGSTAVGAIWAKPIVDILVEIDEGEDIRAVALSIERCGFIRMSDSDKRISFNKGYSENGFEEKIYHLHLRHKGDNDELYFRDYLKEFPCVAKDYETLKLELWHKFEFDRDAYTAAKTDFVKTHTEKAREIYAHRYE